MPKVVTKGKERIIVFDQKDEQVLREKRLKMHEVAKTLRDTGINLYRCVDATTDPVNVKLFSIPANDNDKAVFEVCFPGEQALTEEKMMSIVNENAAVIMLKGYKVLSKKLYKDPDEPSKVTGKILVTINK